MNRARHLSVYSRATAGMTGERGFRGTGHETMSTGEFLDQAVEVAVAETCSAVIGWCGTREVSRRLRAEARTYWGWLTDHARARAFYETMRVPGTTWKDYRCRLVTGKNGTALIGVRFQLGLRDEAFVQLYARNFGIGDSREIPPLVKKCLDAYARFAPRCVRVRLQNIQKVGEELREVVDFVTVAGHLEELRDSCLDNVLVSVSSAETTDWYGAYRRAYDELHDEVPRLRAVVQADGHEEMARAVTRREVYEVRIGGTWAGIAVVRQACREGMRGYALGEQVLTSRFRGKGFGAAVQRKLVAMLDGRRRKVLFGSIAPQNVASMATARRVGRVPVSYCVFFHL